MADYGMLGALGQGLQSGFQSYMQERNRQEDMRQRNLAQALQEKSLAASALEKGLNPSALGLDMSKFQPDQAPQIPQAQSLPQQPDLNSQLENPKPMASGAGLMGDQKGLIGAQPAQGSGLLRSPAQGAAVGQDQNSMYLPWKQHEIQKKSDAIDPDSQYSKAKYATLVNAMESAQPGSSKTLPPKMSGEDVDNQTKLLEFGVKAGEQRDLRNTAQGTRSDKRQDDAMDKGIQLINTARGNPAVRQAELDIYNSKKADSLANMYGDPNKLSQPQVNLLVQELGKVATGGSPAMHELDGLKPGTLTGELSSVWSRLSNNPTPANAGAFVKQYQDYIHAITKDAQDTIAESYGRPVNALRQRMGEGNFKNLQDTYLNRFNQPSNASTPQLSTQDQQAIQWAKSNPKDPRAAQILQMHGM